MDTDKDVVQEKSPKVKEEVSSPVSSKTVKKTRDPEEDKKEVSSPVSSKTVKKTQDPEEDKKTPSKETKTPAKNFFGSEILVIFICSCRDGSTLLSINMISNC